MAARMVPAPKRATTAASVRTQRGPLTAAGTFGLGDDVLLFDTTAGALPANLPAAADVPPGTTYTAAISAGANNVTLTAAGSDTIEGAATSVITPVLRAVGVQTDGVSRWTRIEAGFWA